MQSVAQKKLIPATASDLTGIALPENSKKDTRSLTVAATRVLLETESKKKGANILSAEVFFLPPAGFSTDQLNSKLQQNGWQVTPAEGNKDFYWLQKEGKAVLAYFFIREKQADLYFGEASTAPVTGNNTNGHTQQTTVKTQTVQQQPQQTNTNTPPGNTTAKQDGFTFTVTNFDDGWTSVCKEDWVEVNKGNIKVILHYPNKQADAYHSVLKEGDYNAWNVLVAPRYSNMNNFEWKTIQSYESISFMQADATENASGKSVHIVLFKKHYSNGNGRYIEFVTDHKADYENEFGPYHAESYGWDKPAAMQYRNKFSVAAADLIGKWTTSDYASVSYYYVNTGGLAGTTATSTADEYIFLPNNNYQSQHSGASGQVGNMKFSNQEYKGKSTVTNWNITLTNRFQGATEKYDCYFEAIKGGRVLLMTDRLNTTHALVKKNN